MSSAGAGAARVTYISVKHRGTAKKLALHAGIPVGDINKLIRSSFNLITSVIGLEDVERGVVFPLSLLSKDLSLFQQTTVYSLLLSFDPSHVEEKSDLNESYESGVSGLEESKFSEQDYSGADGEEFSDGQDAYYSARLPDDEGGSDSGENEEPEEESADGDGDENRNMLAFIQEHTAFKTLPMNEILEVFRSAASETGVIDRATFERCFLKVVSKRAGVDAKERQVVSIIANKIFTIFDRDQNGIVDQAEFLAGLSLLCRASSGDKIQAAFNLFDVDNDGHISYQEMLRYMTSFFEVCFALDSNMRKRFGNTSAKEVGIATANHCFSRADANQDGYISFEEFKDWCNSEDAMAAATVPR